MADGARRTQQRRHGPRSSMSPIPARHDFCRLAVESTLVRVDSTFTISSADAQARRKSGVDQEATDRGTRSRLKVKRPPFG